MIPKAFGIFLWKGVKKRIAKKTINRWYKYRFLKEFKNYGIGSLIQDCSGLNVIIKEIDPKIILFKNGYVVYDIDFINERGGSCSLIHCGVDHPISKEEAEKYRNFILNNETSKGWGFDKNYSFENMIINEDGTYLRKDWGEI